MKKIVTLALTLFILSSAAFSQTFISVSFNRPMVSVGFAHRYIETYSFTKYQMDQQLININSAYNQQVKEVMKLRINAAKKVDLIQQLQKERNNKIKNVNNRFFDYRNKYNYNHYDRHFNWIK